MRSRDAIDPLASNVIVHSGVGTPSPPAGKTRRIAIVDPAIVPVIVPLFALWHEAHEPSAAFSADRSALPAIALPVCASDHVIFSGPCGSEPVPAHAPASVVLVSGVTDVEGVAGEAGGGVLPLHAIVHASTAAPAATSDRWIKTLCDRFARGSSPSPAADDTHPTRARTRRSASRTGSAPRQAHRGPSCTPAARCRRDVGPGRP